MRAAIAVVAVGLVLGAVATVALALGLPHLPDDASLDPALGLEEQTFEFVVLDEKLRMSDASLAGVVIAVGDSSALHGFDPSAFQQGTAEQGHGLPAANLATFGFADVDTSLRMTQRALAHGRPAAVVLWVHPRSIARPRAFHEAAGYMSWLRRRVACGDCALGRIDRANQRVSGPLRLGLKGMQRPWVDSRHGWSGPAEVRAVMREHGGQVPVGTFGFDAPEDPPAISFDAFATLAELDATCVAAGVPLFVVLQPYVDASGIAPGQLAEFAGVLAQAMPSMTLVTAVPPVMPAAAFEQPGHLGRDAAAAVSARIGAFVAGALATPGGTPGR